MIEFVQIGVIAFKCLLNSRQKIYCLPPFGDRLRASETNLVERCKERLAGGGQLFVCEIADLIVGFARLIRSSDGTARTTLDGSLLGHSHQGLPTLLSRLQADRNRRYRGLVQP